jgi:hypothetical protein
MTAAAGSISAMPNLDTFVAVVAHQIGMEVSDRLAQLTVEHLATLPRWS